MLALLSALSCDGDDNDPAPAPTAGSGEAADASTRAQVDSGSDAGDDREEPPKPPESKPKPTQPSDMDGDAGAPAKDAGESAEDAGADPRPKTCSVKSTALAPTLWLVVDGSGSMLEMLGDVSRWQAMKDALMDPNKGVVKTLEREVKWGLWMFDGPVAGPQLLPDGGVAMPTSPPATTCPRVVSVDPAFENYQAIAKAYPPDPLGGSTPTDKALQALINKLGSSEDPTSIVFATDGAPNDFCSMDLFPPDVRPNVVAAVKQLADRHIPTYVISLAGGDATLMEHLTSVAQSGGTNHPPFAPQNAGDLQTALRSIVNDETGCVVRLDARIMPARRCDATIKLAGSQLGCDAADGYMVQSPSTLRLQGDACLRYKKDKSSLQIELACDALE